MALRFCLLASGSKGNAIYIGNHKAALLVDCGLSAKQLLLRLEAAGLPAHSIKGIVITHEHRDHVGGVGVAARRLRVPVLSTKATWENCPNLGPVRHESFAAGSPFELAGLSITPFATSHDAADPVGLVVKCGAARLGIATDLGQATALVRARLAGCQALVLEHNHDPQMLAQGPYQEWLKQRVRSRHGHLSNQQGSELLAQVHHADLAQVVLAHLSEVNNLPHLAQAEAARALEELQSSASLHVAGQHLPTPVMEI